MHSIVNQRSSNAVIPNTGKLWNMIAGSVITSSLVSKDVD